MRSATTTPVLRQARAHLLEHGDCLPGMVDERLARSWRRSLDSGVVPTARMSDARFDSGSHLHHLLAQNHELVNHSRPVMEYLYQQVRQSHSMVILSDNRGVLMHTLGDADFLGRAERVALAAGASWHEEHRGTNAIGTALAESCGLEIHGAEHFLERNSFLTCAAAPIVGADGSLLGILDISGDQRSRHPHTLGLVKTAARLIENRLMSVAYRQAIRLHVHTQREGIGTVAEGVFAVSEDGWIIGANRNALELMGLSRMDLAALPLERLFGKRMNELLSRQNGAAGPFLPLRRPDGTMLYAQIHHDQPAIRGTSAPAGSEPVSDALTALDTGDARWRLAADKARRVAGKPISVLLYGESGVGKELFARAMHESGARRHGPFVAINCAALPENLIEAELFGYVGGAFTGARREGNPGRLREANGGTLFLDEIGDMPLLMQTRLLRVLQERQVQPLGGGAPVSVDFSLICATHRDLREHLNGGSFRSDLYYRINGLTLNLPALRERSDFRTLTARLLDDLAPGLNITVASTLLSALSAYHWPGNLRQYANVLRTAVAMLNEGEYVIDWNHLPDDITDELQRLELNGVAERTLAPAVSVAGTRNLDEISRQLMRDAVVASRGNMSDAARRLGVSRQTLYRKLKAAQ